jgi:peptide/nickel transport system permease protein
VSKYVLRRLLLLVPTLIGMSILIFVMLRLLPGDVVDVMTSGDTAASNEQKRQLREAFGLDKPVPLQYLDWLGGMARGDLGRSLRTRESVTAIIVRSLPVTLEIAALAALMTTISAIPLGVLSAVRRDASVDYWSRVAGLIGLSLPNFWLATLVLLFTSLWFHWVPQVNYVSPFVDPLGNLAQMLIPAAAIALREMATVMRMTRTMMLEVLRQDYVRTARAKGAAEKRVVYLHALQNALIPVVSIIGFQVGGLMGGSAIVEVIFGLNGLGNTLVQGIFNRDYPLIQAAALFLATIFVLVNLFVDVLYGYLDPRVKLA